MHLKEGASLAGLGEPMELARHLVEECYAAFGCECWITSGSERATVHHGQPVDGGAEDPHYEGKALDFRLWNVPVGVRAALVEAIRNRLGPEYVVLWESRRLRNEHLHVQAGRVSV